MLCALAWIRRFSNSGSGMDLSKVVECLEKIAPSVLAEKWDNVGLLIEPTSPHVVKRIFLTNDLTEEVLQESIDDGADMIVSYHPPIFRALKRITSKEWKERIITRALENRIAIYSPHTASDAVQNGVNDWLATALGDISSTKPIKQSIRSSTGGLVLCGPSDRDCFDHISQDHPNTYEKVCAGDFGVMSLCKVGPSDIADHVEAGEAGIKGIKFFGNSLELVPRTGAGRLCHLRQATPLKALAENIKTHLNLSYLRVGLAAGKTMDDLIQTVALCAGSGSSVLSGCKADLYLTGEMSHHEVLDATQNGISIILCEHSNSERGYLQLLRRKILETAGNGKLSITVSQTDRDPIEVV